MSRKDVIMLRLSDTEAEEQAPINISGLDDGPSNNEDSLLWLIPPLLRPVIGNMRQKVWKSRAEELCLTDAQWSA